jgi:hypothetical protein
VIIALALVAAILAGIDLIRSRFSSLTAWAVEALALAFLLPPLL